MCASVISSAVLSACLDYAGRFRCRGGTKLGYIVLPGPLLHPRPHFCVQARTQPPDNARIKAVRREQQKRNGGPREAFCRCSQVGTACSVLMQCSRARARERVCVQISRDTRRMQIALIARQFIRTNFRLYYSRLFPLGDQWLLVAVN